MKNLGIYGAADFGKVSDIVNTMTDDQVALAGTVLLPHPRQDRSRMPDFMPCNNRATLTTR